MKDLLSFLAASPSPFHAVDNLAQELQDLGYERLSEGRAWTLSPGGKYFFTRNGSSLLAFRVPKADFTGFLISHDDTSLEMKSVYFA